MLRAASRLDRLHLSTPKARRQRADLESALRSVAADITTIRDAVERGNLSQAIGDVQNLSSVDAVRAAIRNIDAS